MEQAVAVEQGRRVSPETLSAVAARAAAARPEGAPSELSELMRRILSFYDPVRVWLFGSRARGEARATSDWDLMVVVDDPTPEAVLDLDVAWRLQHGSGVYADIVVCRESDFESDVRRPNTIAFDAGREGVLLHAR